MKLVVTLLVLSLTVSVGEENKLSPRITGGYRAKTFTIIYLVGIVYFETQRSPLFYGAGTLISNQWILTVNHVLKYKYIEVHLASRRSYRGFDIIRVYRENFHFHQDKQRVIALVKCPYQKFDYRMNRVRVPAYGTRNNRFTGNMTMVCGYGTSKRNGKLPEWMHCIEVPVISNTECIKYYEQLNPFEMCTSGEGYKAVCGGDVGGAVVTMGDNPTLIGIIWLMPTNCSSGYPSVHIRVSDHIMWIKRISGVGF
ncbi:serine protease 1 [Drosophila santomea]|uniref:serine protease 1 n=1 Tax=Drosophila santomea TaxID=129105 RepID=UPI00195478F1|nr:serine protease 1 [Drosophila santomea]